ncbi:hypothetical protein TBLA_0A00610 [Henningerozyma blattae CBS 6284]|uniref:Bud emergence protein 1 n=1 Tax=Henningerozyma blattae (strain ATCC 34711 / CBS 6284 / DSM 70876 / NBRC 10599 / NRRL Y-10934 / UCD 77-7) TaxID=1071380 RepID=I2GUR0_HENB6|nr:hypothetical protein TBLA_0A00610 [Tetrapisispora blattae CBS 6284]CCH57862.1 hypothetical protein TBLA_0A00610 [Tetrapisispora blattae CBS 6284]
MLEGIKRTPSFSRVLSNSSNTQISKPPTDISSPEMAIEALRDYTAVNIGEISFSKGDFFYVAGEEGIYYYATNPLTGTEGNVKKRYFKTFNKSRPVLSPRQTNSSNTNSTATSPSSRSLSRKSSSSNRVPPVFPDKIEMTDIENLLPDSKEISGDKKKKIFKSLYALCLYDFEAAKEDELTVYAGETLFIYAHYEEEWFIGRPLGRIGGPGLVPISFVNIIDISTGYISENPVAKDIQDANLLTIEDWRKSIYEYEREDMILQAKLKLLPREPSILHENYAIDESEIITNAGIKDVIFENNKYWFIIYCELLNGMRRDLKRHYNEFYNFQVQLLNAFPAEAGNCKDANTGVVTRRIIPYIPTTSHRVTENLTMRRKKTLNIYLKDIIMLPDYISRSKYVKELFELRYDSNGFDVEYEIDINDKDPYLLNITPRQATISALDSNELNNTDSAASSNLRSPIENSNLRTPIENINFDSPNNLFSSKNGYNQSPTPKSLSTNDRSAPRNLKRSTSINSSFDTNTTKIKIYYNYDIFAVKLDNNNCTLSSLREKVQLRLPGKDFIFRVKLADGDAEEIVNDTQLYNVIDSNLKISLHEKRH